MVWAMVGVSLVILTGWAGNISLGQFGIVGVGGVVAANFIDRWNSDLFFVLLAAGAAGALVALVVGLPALRIKGLFLAVTTLSFALLLDQYFLNQVNFPQFIPGSFDRPLLWERFDLKDNYHMYLVCLAFLGLSIMAAIGVRKARSGRVLLATRDNQRAADAASVPTTSIKLSGFVLAGVIAGMAGALEVLLNRSVGQGTFAPEYSLTVFSTAVIGGLGSISGALFGVFLFRWLETVKALGQLRQGRDRRGPARRAVVLARRARPALLLVARSLPSVGREPARHPRAEPRRRQARRRRRGQAVRRGRPSSRRARRSASGRRAMSATDTLERHVPPSGNGPLLSCHGIDMAYGPVQILFDVDFEVTEGEIVALLGTNGAGKSTLLKGICGLVRPKRGKVVFADEDITSLPADVTTHRGISLMPGGKGVFPTLTVAENLRLAGWLIRNEPARVEEAREKSSGSSRSSRRARARWRATCRAASSRCSRSAAR